MADPAQSDASPAPPPPPRRLRLSWRAVFVWSGFALALVLIVAYLIVPAFRFGANLSPPGPAAWDQPQTVAKPTVTTPVKPAVSAPPTANAADAAEGSDDAVAGDDDSSNGESNAATAPPSPPPAAETDMLAAIDRARTRALDGGAARHWSGGGREGYVVPSEPVSDGVRECRNAIVTIITADEQPRSSSTRYCRDDEGSDWRPQ